MSAVDDLRDTRAIKWQAQGRSCSVAPTGSGGPIGWPVR